MFELSSLVTIFVIIVATISIFVGIIFYTLNKKKGVGDKQKVKTTRKIPRAIFGDGIYYINNKKNLDDGVGMKWKWWLEREEDGSQKEKVVNLAYFLPIDILGSPIYIDAEIHKDTAILKNEIKRLNQELDYEQQEHTNLKNQFNDRLKEEVERLTSVAGNKQMEKKAYNRDIPQS